MKEIIITNRATINAEGKLNCSRCKPVVDITALKTFTSVTDAAKWIGSTPANLVRCLKSETKVLKKHKFCYLSEIDEYLNDVFSQGQSSSEEKVKAALWDALMAEQEAARKAEEERIEAERKAKEELAAKIIKTEEKLARRKAIYEHKLAEAKAADERVAQTEQELYELYALLGNKANEKEVEVA